jgi:hypothetical protein
VSTQNHDEQDPTTSTTSDPPNTSATSKHSKRKSTRKKPIRSHSQNTRSRFPLPSPEISVGP